ncbi:MAG TPA: amidinotransferase, partial [Nocardioides sp.]|nr:amidinotransferase [Nocardioides sp.]
MGNELAWGRQYVMVRPDHFRVDYQINPFMDLADQPDPVRARQQWDTLVDTIRSLGGEVDVIGQR